MKRFWRWLLWFPDELDAAGNPDHGKLMGDLVLLAIIGAQLAGHGFSAPVAAVLVIGSHGSRMVLAAIKGGVFGAKAP